MNGQLQIKNIRGFNPFMVNYRDFTQDVIEVDVIGRGILRERPNEIKQRIAEMWTIYDELAQHSSKDIGIYYEICPGLMTKKKTRLYPEVQDATIKLWITYKKPFPDPADSFELTTEMIVSNILDCIFLIPI